MQEEKGSGNEQLPETPTGAREAPNCVLHAQGGPPRLSGVGLAGGKQQPPRSPQPGGPGKPRAPGWCDRKDRLRPVSGSRFPLRAKESSHPSVCVSPDRAAAAQTTPRADMARVTGAAARAASTPSHSGPALRHARRHVGDGAWRWVRACVRSLEMGGNCLPLPRGGERGFVLPSCSHTCCGRWSLKELDKVTKRNKTKSERGFSRHPALNLCPSYALPVRPRPPML